MHGKVLIIAATVLGLLLLGGIAYASIPDSDGVIHGCYKTSNPGKGAVVVIDTDAGATCASGFTSLNWNQTGPQGPQGIPGISGLHVVGGLVGTIDGTGNLPETLVACHGSETAISSGFFYGPNGPPPAGWRFSQNHPFGGSIGTTWVFAGQGGNPGDQVMLLVTCGNTN